MNLDNIDIELEARTNPQAVNLGFVTARRYFWSLFLSGGLAFIPIFVLALLITYYFDNFTLASILIWWSKPYIDRVILLNASQLMFRETLTLNDRINSLSTALKNGLWLNLSFFRLSMQRSLMLPIMVLEGLSGKDYTERTKIVSRSSGSTSSATQIGLLHFDFILYVNVFLLIIMLLPSNDYEQLMGFLSGGLIIEEFGLLSVFMLLVQTLVHLIIEIFYVMIGFMLYLNGRVQTEGWHIELAFKQIAQRLSKLSKSSAHAFIIGISALLFSLTPETSHAASEGDELSYIQVDIRGDKAILKDLLLDKENTPYEVTGEWVKNSSRHKEKDPDDYLDDNFDFDGLLSFGPFLKIILIVGAIICVLWLVSKHEQLAGLWQRKVTIPQDEAPPEIMFGLDLRKESLPDDISGSASNLLKMGDKLGALSLLYRGSLATLIHDYNVDIQESDTEGDCLRRSQNLIPRNSFNYFSELTSTWQTIVYAHREVPERQIEQLIKQWQTAFRSPNHSEISA